MNKIRKAAVAVGVAGALSVGALVTIPALAGSDDATVDSPARYGQTTEEPEAVTPSPYCTGTQERDRDQLRIQMQDRDCQGAQLRHQHQAERGQGAGPGQGPGPGHGPGPGAGNGECPFAPDSD
ncbi:MAG TPA: hypothetical protein VFZ63_16605 [Jiangellaceae bacterium]